MLNDKSSRYTAEPPEELHDLLNQAALAFHKALVEGDWEPLHGFIDFIAPKRLKGGFALSEVQRAFERYREIVIPLIVSHIEPERRIPALLSLHHCLVTTVTRFSVYFQQLHEEFLRNQANFLEKEVTRRTQELAESERKYKVLVEDIHDGYFVLVENEIVFANAAFALMHGCDSGSVVGRDFFELVADESKQKVQTGLCSGPVRLEYFRRHLDGDHLPTEIMSKTSSYGEDIARIGICRDISQRVELETKTREAEKLNALAQLAASVAHEINNPLTAIKMNVQMLSKGDLTGQSQHKLAASTLREIEAIKRCVMEMMNLTVPFRLKCQWVNTAALIGDCLKAVETRRHLQGVKITRKLSKDITDIYVDPERIEQAVINLLLNALDVLTNGGNIYITTKVSNHRGGQWNDIHISDDGPGIPREKLPYVFDPFYSQKAGGIGLGLGNVKKIAEAHGGEILVAHRKPGGIEFTLRLPRN